LLFYFDKTMTTSSIADQFHEALEAINSMDVDLNTDHRYRHAIRRFKSIAIDDLKRSFMNCHDLAYHARELKKIIDEA
jgi:hypothetical protein